MHEDAASAAAADLPGSVGRVRTEHASIALPPEGLRLTCGQCLPELTVAYETYGRLAPERDNVIFICHALTGDAHVAGHHGDPAAGRGWWDEMVGPGKGIDTRYYHVVCANILGGCAGTTGPASTDPRTGRPYGSRFPLLSVADIVDVHCLLLRHLGIERLAAVVGGSFGGMQVLDWAIRYPDMVARAVCIASAARLSAQALAFDVVARQSITADPDWQNGDYYGTGRSPDRGLAQARRIGHITYLSPDMMTRKFGRFKRRAADDAGPAGREDRFGSDFEVENYLDHQGRKLVQRFDANAYLHITKSMDDFDLTEKAPSLEAALGPIRAKMLVVALSDDWLFPAAQSMELAHGLVRAGKRVSCAILHAPHGHDAFLVNVAHLSELIHAFLPWVGVRPGAGETAEDDETSVPAARPRGGRTGEWEHIAGMVEPGARVLDVGCGDGELLSLLTRRRRARGTGLDIDLRHVIQVIERGHDVMQADVDSGLAGIPDGSYDYAVLSETLQVVRKPRLVLNEMLRVAREGILAFPNFGGWRHRLYLWRRGRMPKGGALPFEWYDTPNIHLFTLKDFCDLCREDGISILDMVCICSAPLDRWLALSGCCNLAAAHVVVKIARQTEPGRTWRCRDCRFARALRRGGTLR